MSHFDEEIERRGSNSIKWDYASAYCPGFGDIREAAIGPGSGAPRRGDAGQGDAGRYDEIIPAWVADMDFPSPPAVVAAMEARARHPVYGYAGTPASLVEAFSAWLLRRHGLAVEPSWIRAVPGVVPGLGLAIRAFTEPGDGIVIQSPVYHPFASLIRANGRRVLDAPLREEEGRWSMDLEALDRAAEGAKAIILCSPHNPVGRVWRLEELEGLAEIAARRDLVVVSDEIHADLVYAPRRHRPFLELDGGLPRRAAAFYAPSKTFNVAGLQTAFALVPDPGLARAFSAELERTGLGSPNAFGALAAETAYRAGGPWLEEALGYIEGNYRLLAERLAAGAPRIRLSPLEGTYLAFLDFRAFGFGGAGSGGDGAPGVDPVRSGPGLHETLLREAGLWLDEGSKFGPGGRGWARLNLGCPRARIERVAERLVGAFGG